MLSQSCSLKAVQSLQMISDCVYVSCGSDWFEEFFGLGFFFMGFLALELWDRPKLSVTCSAQQQGVFWLWSLKACTMTAILESSWQPKCVMLLYICVFTANSLLCQFMPVASCLSCFVCTCNEQDLSKLLNNLSFSKLKGDGPSSARHKLFTSALCIHVRNITERNIPLSLCQNEQDVIL